MNGQRGKAAMNGFRDPIHMHALGTLMAGGARDVIGNESDERVFYNCATAHPDTGEKG